MPTTPAQVLSSLAPQSPRLQTRPTGVTRFQCVGFFKVFFFSDLTLNGVTRRRRVRTVPAPDGVLLL